MKHVAQVRSELGIRTVFNIMGPLTNPAGACGQLMGVFDAALVEPLVHVLAQLGSRHAFVVSGSDGLDELTLAGPSFVAEAKQGVVKTYEVTPEQFGLARASKEAVRGGDLQENAALVREVLEGGKGPRRDIVLLNAAPAIIAGEGAEDWASGLRAAAQSIDSGAAWAACENLIRVSHDS
jgi:anthranilate phosphoribosyltransferase